MLEGAGRSTKASLAILSRGWVLRRLVIKVLVVEYNSGFSNRGSWLKSGQELMVYSVYLFMCGLVVGVVGVASNPAPYFAALGLVMAAGGGCGLLAGYGGSFLSLVLFLIYLGGILVVFAYSAALAAEPFPESWGDWSVFGYVVGYLALVLGFGAYLWGG